MKFAIKHLKHGAKLCVSTAEIVKCNNARKPKKRLTRQFNVKSVSSSATSLLTTLGPRDWDRSMRPSTNATL